MIHVDGLDFSECHSEEVISFFWRSVYSNTQQHLTNELLRGKTPLSQFILKSFFKIIYECKFLVNSDLDNYMYMDLLDELFYKQIQVYQMYALHAPTV